VSDTVPDARCKRNTRYTEEGELVVSVARRVIATFIRDEVVYIGPKSRVTRAAGSRARGVARKRCKVKVQGLLSPGSLRTSLRHSIKERTT